MPYLSAFTPCGLLKLSSKPSHARAFYESGKAAQGEQFSLDEGTHMEAVLYADSMAYGRTRRLLEHAGEQSDPLKTLETLPLKEEEYGIVPSGTLQQRRQELAARRRLLKGASQANVEEALSILLGSEFVAYRPTPIDEIALWPDELGDQPMNLQPPEVHRRVVRTLDPVTVLGSPVTIRVEQVSPVVEFSDAPPPGYIFKGDKVVVEPENLSNAERVEVLSFLTTFSGTFYLTISAVFTKAHGVGAVITTWPWPMWTSTKRHNLIVVSDAAAQDAETRRKINELMNRILRGVSTWAIAGETEADMTGPFLLGEGMLSVTTFGEIDLDP